MIEFYNTSTGEISEAFSDLATTRGDIIEILNDNKTLTTFAAPISWDSRTSYAINLYNNHLAYAVLELHQLQQKTSRPNNTRIGNLENRIKNYACRLEAVKNKLKQDNKKAVQ